MRPQFSIKSFYRGLTYCDIDLETESHQSSMIGLTDSNVITGMFDATRCKRSPVCVRTTFDKTSPETLSVAIASTSSFACCGAPATVSTAIVATNAIGTT